MCYKGFFLKRPITALFLTVNIISGIAMAGRIDEILPDAQEDLSAQLKNIENIDQIRVNVFIHGTYELGTIPLNFFTSFWDKDLRGTLHEKIVRDFMRKQVHSIYETSLMYHEGLYRVDVSGPADSVKEFDELALLPIIRSFDAVTKAQDEKLRPSQKITDLNYLFGWSGLLNAGARREAGLCLFNAISSEKKKLADFIAKKKAKTKIYVRFFCHSHGGNVALNCAWAQNFGRDVSVADFYKSFALDQFGIEAESKFGQLIRQIPQNAQDAVGKSPFGMDNWLFRPVSSENVEPLVDELYLVASPIQPETWPLIFSGTFQRVISLFSYGDNIQNLDMISTRNRASDRFLADEIADKGNRLFSKDGLPKFVQINVILPPKKSTLQIEKPAIESDEIDWLQDKIRSFVRENQFIPEIKGPRHLEFWYISWHGISDRLCIRPVPIVVFAPLIDQPWLRASKLLVQFSTSKDGDLLIESLDAENDGHLSTISNCKKDLFESIKNEFFDRKERLENIELIKIKSLNKLIGNIGRMALFMATS